MVAQPRCAGTGTGTAPASGATPPTTTASEVVFGVSMWNSGTPDFHEATGDMTELAELSFGTKGIAVDEQVVTAPGSYADSGVLRAGVLWTDSVATYRRVS